jgi:hypothetical protein
MANEIYGKYSSGFDLDAYVFRKTDDAVFIQTTGLFETWNDANVLTYDIPMTDQGDGFYSVDFPVAITDEGTFRVIIKLRTGVNAEVGNTGLFQGEITWSGESETDIFTLLETSSTVLNVYGINE